MSFDKNVAPAFVKHYYQLYLSNPLELETMYTSTATFSHADVKPFTPGADATPQYALGLDQIREQLMKLSEGIKKTPHMKVCFVHLDSTPSVNHTITVLAGGYFLLPESTCRFVHSFVLQSTSKNNFLIVNDCLRLYSKHDAAVGQAVATLAKEEAVAPAPAKVEKVHVAEEPKKHHHAAPAKEEEPAPAAAPEAREDWGDAVDEPAQEEEAAEEKSDDKPASSYAAAVRAKAAAAKAPAKVEKLGGAAPKVPAPAAKPAQEEKKPKRTEKVERKPKKAEEGEEKAAGEVVSTLSGSSHFCAILKNLPSHCTDAELTQLLAPHVTVTALRNNTSQGRNFAFVNFENEAMIETMQQAGLSLRGSKIDIEHAHDKFAPGAKPRGSSGRGERRERREGKQGEGRERREPRGDGEKNGERRRDGRRSGNKSENKDSAPASPASE